MSDYERHKGSIEKILCDNLEEFAKNLIDTELPEYYDNYDEVLDEVNLKITEPSELEWKEDIEEISYSGDFWYALTNCYINLDELLVDNQAKEKLKEAISILEDFECELTSQDFFVEM